MKVLELFSGTHSVGKVAESMGHTVTSVDLKGATININILDWDYTQLPKDSFDIIWASPPCHTFSIIRNSWIGRTMKEHGQTIITDEILEQDIDERGLPLLHKTFDIIDYFNPKYFLIENPQTGKMKDYIPEGVPYYDVDYCMYSDWGYQKRTRIWTDIQNFNPKKCNGKCGNMIDGRHKKNLGGSQRDENGKLINTYEKRVNFKGTKKNDKVTTIKERYRVPEKLIRELFSLI